MKLTRFLKTESYYHVLVTLLPDHKLKLYEKSIFYYKPNQTNYVYNYLQHIMIPLQKSALMVNEH